MVHLLFTHRLILHLVPWVDTGSVVVSQRISSSYILVWKKQAEHLDAVKEMVELVTVKGRRLQVWTLPGRMDESCEEHERFLVLYHTELGGGEKPVSLPVISNGLQGGRGLGGGRNLGRLMHTPMLIFRYPKSMQKEISILSSLTKNLQLKRSCLGSEGMKRESNVRCFKLSYTALKVWNVP
jgi:hypothetical protein